MGVARQITLMSEPVRPLSSNGAATAYFQPVVAMRISAHCNNFLRRPPRLNYSGQTKYIQECHCAIGVWGRKIFFSVELTYISQISSTAPSPIQCCFPAMPPNTRALKFASSSSGNNTPIPS